jgi:predicted MFS family arabinose efflux permease
MFKTSIDNFRSRFHTKLRLVGLISTTIFFLAVFNSITAYLAPIIMLDSGMSEMTMGLIYSSSSFFGFILDFVLAKVLKSTNYKRMLIYTIIAASLFPISMLVGQNVIFYILGMLFWGVYSNLWGFAYYDFAAREAKVAFHATSLSLLFIFLDLGDFIGMLLAEPISNMDSNINILLILLAILSLSAVSLILTYFIKSHSTKSYEENHGNFNKIVIVSKKLFPLLLFGTLLNIIEAVIWTITPIVDRVAPQINNYGGILLAVSIVPSFFTNLIIQRIDTKKNKKRIALVSFIIGSLLLAMLGLTTTVTQYFILTFLYSTCFAIVYPMLGGAFADYLSESKSYDNEILSSKDMFANIGYIIGPIVGTFLLTVTDSLYLFTYLGVSTAILALILYFIIPKRIPFKDRDLLNPAL